MMDGHKSHLYLPFLERLRELNIVLGLRYPHSSHKTQVCPVYVYFLWHRFFLFILMSSKSQVEDVSVFGPFKNSYATALRVLVTARFATKAVGGVTLADFNSVFQPAWQAAMSEANIKNGYRKTGVVPFDRAVYHQQREAESTTIAAMKKLSPDQTARLEAVIAAQGASYSKVVVDKTKSPLSDPTRKRRRPDEVHADGDGVNSYDEDDGAALNDDAALDDDAAPDDGAPAPEDVPLEALFAYDGGVTGDAAMAVVRAKAAKRQAKDDRSTAAASKRDAKNLRDAAAANKCLQQTPIDLAAWSDKDIRVVLAQRFKTKAPGKASRGDMVIDLRRRLVAGGFALVGQA